jgi:hypothetical protein
MLTVKAHVKEEIKQVDDEQDDLELCCAQGSAVESQERRAGKPAIECDR